MFSPVPMQRLSVMVLARDERVVLRALGEMRVLHLEHTPAIAETTPAEETRLKADLAQCHEILGRITEIRAWLQARQAGEGGLRREPSGAELAGRDEPLTLAEADTLLRAIQDRIARLHDRSQRLLLQSTELDSLRAQIAAYRGLELPVARLRDSAFLHFALGTVPAKDWETFRAQAGSGVVLLLLERQGGDLPVLTIGNVRGTSSPVGDTAWNTFKPAVLPPAMAGEVGRDTTVRMLLDDNQVRAEATAADLARVRADEGALAVEAPPVLDRVERSVRVERRFLEAMQKTSRTRATAVLTGWAAADEAPAILRRLRSVSDGRCVVQVEGTDSVAEDDIPVRLRHRRLLRPFEMLVSAYGLPRYRDVEPTLFVALTYLLMFGMMFGDAGHGAVLAAAGLVALFVGRTRKVRDTGLLILFGGLSSVAFGVAYGSYFGIPALRPYGVWVDPLAGNPVRFLGCAIAIGVVMLSLGLTLNIVNRLRHGDVVGGVVDKYGVFGAVFYWAALALVAKGAALHSHQPMAPLLVFCLALPLAGWVMRGPLHRARGRLSGATQGSDGTLAAVLESVVEAFEEILGYLANTISFVRIAAYAMSHGALLVATYALAEEVRRIQPGGAAMGVLAILAGNAVAIVLEGLVAAVQALRLEYYEFFSKFQSGTGRRFEPFCLASGNREACET